jgi:hypothetical protein
MALASAVPAHAGIAAKSKAGTSSAKTARPILLAPLNNRWPAADLIPVFFLKLLGNQWTLAHPLNRILMRLLKSDGILL